MADGQIGSGGITAVTNGPIPLRWISFDCVHLNLETDMSECDMHDVHDGIYVSG